MPLVVPFSCQSPSSSRTSASSVSLWYGSVTQQTAAGFLVVIKLFFSNHNYSFILGFLSIPPNCLGQVFSGTRSPCLLMEDVCRSTSKEGFVLFTLFLIATTGLILGESVWVLN